MFTHQAGTHTFVRVRYADENDPRRLLAPKWMCFEHGPDCPVPPPEDLDDEWGRGQ